MEEVVLIYSLDINVSVLMVTAEGIMKLVSEEFPAATVGIYDLYSLHLTLKD